MVWWSRYYWVWGIHFLIEVTIINSHFLTACLWLCPHLHPGQFSQTVYATRAAVPAGDHAGSRSWTTLSFWDSRASGRRVAQLRWEHQQSRTGGMWDSTSVMWLFQPPSEPYDGLVGQEGLLSFRTLSPVLSQAPASHNPFYKCSDLGCSVGEFPYILPVWCWKISLSNVLLTQWKVVTM